MAQCVTLLNDGTVNARPIVSITQVINIALECFGLVVDEHVAPKELNSYDDRNFLLKGRLLPRENELDTSYRHFQKFVLKITNSYETHLKPSYDRIDKLMLLCSERCKQNFKIPVPIHTVNNADTSWLYDLPLQEKVTVDGGSVEELHSNKHVSMEHDFIGTKTYTLKHIVRLFVYVPGKVLTTKDITDKLAFDYGKAIAMIDETMQGFPAPENEIRSTWIWNLLYASQGLKEPYVSCMQNEERKAMLTKILDRYEKDVKPKLGKLPKQWIHGDPNEQNILVNQGKQGGCDIVGVIDFNDMVYSYRVVDLAICLMYITAVSPLHSCTRYAKQLFKGYTSKIKLFEEEISVLFPMILMRYAQCCAISEYQYTYVDPNNEYLLTTSKSAWKILEYLVSEGEQDFMKNLLQ